MSFFSSTGSMIRSAALGLVHKGMELGEGVVNAGSEFYKGLSGEDDYAKTLSVANLRIICEMYSEAKEDWQKKLCMEEVKKRKISDKDFNDELDKVQKHKDSEPKK